MSLVLAYFMAFTDLMSEGLTDTKRQIFVVILVGYAIYRAYRLYSALRAENNTSFEDEEEVE